MRGSGRHRSAALPMEHTPSSSQPVESDSTLLGSVHYLAPERLEGHDADASGDLFALGVVMYEMATGRRPFEGGSAAAVIAGILRSNQPPPSSVRPDVPPSLDWVIQKCLAKNPESRWQAAGDIVEVLRWLARVPAVDAAGQPRRRAWMLPVAAAAALAIAGSMFAAGRFSAARQTPAFRRWPSPSSRLRTAVLRRRLRRSRVHNSRSRPTATGWCSWRRQGRIRRSSGCGRLDRMTRIRCPGRKVPSTRSGLPTVRRWDSSRVRR